MESNRIDDWLLNFPLDTGIRAHLAAVMLNLPQEVRSDLMDDPSFTVCDYAPGPNVTLHVPMRLTAPGHPGRSIVLKRTLLHRPTPFARWVIAHELAHAYLRHGSLHPLENPEQSADSLAAQWGFPKPR
jgi:Zn-dependent protease with chaperone function